MIPIPTGLKEAIIKKGFNPPSHIYENNPTRFSTNDNPLDIAGNITPLPDGFGYRFYCFRTGISGAWHNNDVSNMTSEERTAYEKRLKEAKEKHVYEQDCQWYEAAQKAKAFMDETQALSSRAFSD